MAQRQLQSEYRYKGDEGKEGKEELQKDLLYLQEWPKSVLDKVPCRYKQSYACG